jgi:CBS domain-containing protein
MVEQLPTAGDLLTREYLVLAPALPILDAIHRLERDRAHTAFVFDEHDALVGLLTDKDCVRVLGARAYDEAVAETVGDVMTPAPDSVTPATDVYTIAQVFGTTPAGMLPVVDHGRVVGGVSQRALLRAMLELYRHRSEAWANVERACADLKDPPTSIERMQRVFADWNPEQLASLLRRNR